MTEGAGSLLGIALGLGLGARHALEPDHLAAVSGLAAEAPGPRRGMLVGALWGAGHTAALLACGLAVAVAAAEIPAAVARAFELLVAAMLIVLGGRAVYRAAREPGREPRALALHRHRPLAVGAVHGLAGSGALTALVMAELPTMPARLLFMALFGVGSIAAMSVVSGLAGVPLARLGRRPALARAVFATAGAASAALGVTWGWIAVARMLG